MRELAWLMELLDCHPTYFCFEPQRLTCQRGDVNIQKTCQRLGCDSAILAKANQPRQRLRIQRNLPDHARDAYLPPLRENPAHIDRQILRRSVAECAYGNSRDTGRLRFAQDFETLHFYRARIPAEELFFVRA